MIAINDGYLIEFSLEAKHQFVLQNVRANLIDSCFHSAEKILLFDSITNSAIEKLIQTNFELVQVITAILKDQEEIKWFYQELGPDFTKMITAPVKMNFIGLTYTKSNSEDLLDIIQSVTPKRSREIELPEDAEEYYKRCQTLLYHPNANFAGFLNLYEQAEANAHFVEFLNLYEQAEANAKVFGLRKK
ncbi:MAG: hypothetical protein PHN72_02870 [Bacilli bacterium]|nr:hypothetical protein [Bacilli bacterium]